MNKKFRVGAALSFILVNTSAAEAAYVYTIFSDPYATIQTAAHAINDLGQVAGFYYDNTGAHGFIRSADGNVYTSFDEPAASNGPTGSGVAITYTDNTYAMGINNLGAVVGYYYTTLGIFPFYRNSDGTNYATISVPTTVNTSYAINIDDSGQIMGDYADFSGWHGFVVNKSGSGFAEIPVVPNGNFIEIPGITTQAVAFSPNTSGQFVGYYWDANQSHSYSFIATPIPTPIPRSAVMLVVGFGVFWSVVGCNKFPSHVN